MPKHADICRQFQYDNLNSQKQSVCICSMCLASAMLRFTPRVTQRKEAVLVGSMTCAGRACMFTSFFNTTLSPSSPPVLPKL